MVIVELVTKKIPPAWLPKGSFTLNTNTNRSHFPAAVRVAHHAHHVHHYCRNCFHLIFFFKGPKGAYLKCHFLQTAIKKAAAVAAAFYNLSFQDHAIERAAEVFHIII